jgi:S1-C subfamily serine protease
MPTRPDVVFAAFGDLLDTTGFPTVFDDPTKDRLSPVAPAGDAIRSAPGVVRAEASTVKIHGDAPSCNRRLEGSGFVVDAHRVITNAHVLAGVSDVQVLLGTQARRFSAQVVAFDPQQDLAELWVPDLDLTPLAFGGPAVRGEVAAALGFPGDGPLTVSPARVRGATTAAGRDIYGKSAAVREIYSLRTQVRPGNSGGPLVDDKGKVIGVVFAAAVDDPTTGYALTAARAEQLVRATGDSTSPVSTGPCA